MLNVDLILKFLTECGFHTCTETKIPFVMGLLGSSGSSGPSRPTRRTAFVTNFVNGFFLS